jgi:hypothetical protein
MDPNLDPLKISGIVILGKNGNRIVSKYYGDNKQTTEEQFKFEEALHAKVARQQQQPSYDADIFTFDDYVIPHKFFEDVRIFVLLHPDENELIGLTILNTLSDTLSILFDQRVTRAAVNNNLDMVTLILDELLDDGLILETNPEQILQRVSMRENSMPVASQDQTLASAVQNVTDQLFRTLRG